MRSKYLSLFLINFSALGLVFAINAYRQTNAHSYGSTAKTVQSVLETESRGPVRNLRFTLFEQGVRPSDMRIKAGLVNILIEDRTRVAQNVMIQRVTGTDRIVVGIVEKWPNQFRGRNSFRLGPGEYELFDSTHPQHKAVLTVEP